MERFQEKSEYASTSDACQDVVNGARLACVRIKQLRIVQIMSLMALPIRGCIRLALKLPLKLLKPFTLPAVKLASLVSSFT